jgi:hypothetical protein
MGRRLCCQWGGRAARNHNERSLAANQIGSKRGQPLDLIFGLAVFDRNIATFGRKLEASYPSVRQTKICGPQLPQPPLLALRVISLLRSNGVAFKVKRTPRLTALLSTGR